MSDCSSVVVAGLGDSSCTLVDRQSQLSVTIANVRTKRESKLVFRDWAVCCVGGPPTRDWSFGGLSVSHGESAGARTYLYPGRAGDDMRSDSNDDKLPSRVHRCSSQCVCVYVSAPGERLRLSSSSSDVSTAPAYAFCRRIICFIAHEFVTDSRIIPRSGFAGVCEPRLSPSWALIG